MESQINNLSIRLISEFIGYSVIVSIIVFIIFRLLIFIYHILKTSGFEWRGGPHTWAVITGSTDGIGLAYAKQLAEKGYNLLLISRNQQKLDKVRDEIQDRYGCKRKIRILAIDFSTSSDDIYDEIEAEFENLDEIHVLVNNVGTNYPNERPEYLTQIPNLKEVIMNLINVNIISCTRLTALVLPRMERRGRGVIINLSSFSAIFPVPLLTLYSATKVYVDFMSRALQEEYRTKGIIIQSVLPYYVSTHMTYNMETTFFVPTPDRYVRHALTTVGREDRTAGIFVHSVWSFINHWTGFWSKISGIDFDIKFAYWRLKRIRKRILVKENQPLNNTELNTQEQIV